jgi:hypothetical protein
VGCGGAGGVTDDQQRHCGQCNITEKVRMSLNSIEVINDLVALTSVATIGAVSILAFFYLALHVRLYLFSPML